MTDPTTDSWNRSTAGFGALGILITVIYCVFWIPPLYWDTVPGEMQRLRVENALVTALPLVPSASASVRYRYLDTPYTTEKVHSVTNTPVPAWTRISLLASTTDSTQFGSKLYRVPVFVNPRNPTQACIDRSPHLAILALAPFGTLLMVYALLIDPWLGRRQARSSTQH